MSKTNYAPSFAYIVKKRLQKKSFLYEFYFKGKSTLDIGCGNGEFMVNDPKMFTGTDLNPDVVKRLKDRGFKADTASADRLPYADNTFEMAHCHNVIEHVTPIVAYGLVKEAMRVLKPGGMFVLSTETVNDEFWDTFGHVRPYPPTAIMKLFREKTREEFEAIRGVEKVGLFYFGNCYRNKLAYFLSAMIGYYTPLFRREFYIVLKKVA